MSQKLKLAYIFYFKVKIIQTFVIPSEIKNIHTFFFFSIKVENINKCFVKIIIEKKSARPLSYLRSYLYNQTKTFCLFQSNCG